MAIDKLEKITKLVRADCGFERKRSVYIAYSTGPGQIADDGEKDANNSPYTEALVNALKEPRKKIEEVFKTTKEHVRNKTKRKQIPWDKQNIIGDFYFNVK